MVDWGLIAWPVVEGEREDEDGRFVGWRRHMRRGEDRRMALHGEYQKSGRWLGKAIGLSV